VNTVSPGFAREALTPEGSFGLSDALAAKGDRFVGILNGLDTTVWDPATDADLAARYSAEDLTGKAACRADLLERLGFDPDDDGAVLGMIGRLDPQKGFDLFHDAAPRLLAAGARLVAQGSGSHELSAGFRALAAAQPDRVALIERFDRAMARRIYAGADFFLMPSRFEPCGTGQMVALRYGTPPIVRRTGGLADSVVDELRHPGEGTGFAFDDATPDALADACEAAMTMRSAGGPPWDNLVQRGMAVDFDWDRGSAPQYASLYERAVTIRRS
jgi:starch synthase